MSSYALLCCVASVVGSVIVPLVVYAFRRTYVPARWDEIARHLDCGENAATYIALFAPALGSQEDALRLIKDHYDSWHSKGQYGLPLVWTFIPTLAGLLICTFWCKAKLEGAADGISGIPEPIIMAILGGYVWSLYEVLMRHNSGDLTPTSLYDISFRIIAAVPIGYACSLLSFDKAPAFFAFAASAFPVRDLRRMLRGYFEKEAQTESIPTHDGKGLLGQVVHGLSHDTLARLDEIGIRTTVDLAYADPLKIFQGTGFAVRNVIDWIDQALLGIYVGGRLARLGPRGFRGAIEVCTFYMEHCLDENGKLRPRMSNDSEIKELANILGVEPQSVLRMLKEVYGDPHTDFISKLWGEA
jgi:hypothetical protein